MLQATYDLQCADELFLRVDRRLELPYVWSPACRVGLRPQASRFPAVDITP